MPILPATMRGVIAVDNALHIKAFPLPQPQAGEVLIHVAAAGVNRPDIMQRQGRYDPPPGTTPILGLEAAGSVVALGEGVTEWRVGDKVCALVAGGGYAEYVAAPAGQCLPWPDHLSAVEAACVMEGVFTVWANLFEAGQLKAGETALVHGGTSGIGSYAIQMARAAGALVIVTVGSDAKAETAKGWGADLAVNYETQDFVAAVKDFTGGEGVNVVLDMIGGDYVPRNLAALTAFGRHVSIASRKGAKAEIDIWQMMRRRHVLTGSTLRARPAAEKARLAREIHAHVWPWIAAGKVKAHVFQAFPLEKAGEAHKVMENAAHMGKMALTVQDT
jgi:NADPH2:quinone reductase